jgi:hypothetical protein
MEITHEKIYERLKIVEDKVDRIDRNTEGLVDAFNAMQGAFKVLGWIAWIAKPILAIAAFLAGYSYIVDYMKGKGN